MDYIVHYPRYMLSIPQCTATACETYACYTHIDTYVARTIIRGFRVCIVCVCSKVCKTPPTLLKETCQNSKQVSWNIPSPPDLAQSARTQRRAPRTRCPFEYGLQLRVIRLSLACHYTLQVDMLNVKAC